MKILEPKLEPESFVFPLSPLSLSLSLHLSSFLLSKQGLQQTLAWAPPFLPCWWNEASLSLSLSLSLSNANIPSCRTQTT